MRWDRSSTELRRAAPVVLVVLLVLIGVLVYACSRDTGSSGSASQDLPGSPTASASATGTGSPSVSPTGPAPGSTGSRASPAGTGPATGSASGTPNRAVPWETPRVTAGTPPKNTPSAPAGSADLTILLDDGFGVRATWTLTCSPTGGTHPDPSTACGVLGASGATALPATPTDRMCTQEYGGPQKALVRGTWRGKTIDSQLTLENGCEISRWSSLLGLLPAGGTP